MRVQNRNCCPLLQPKGGSLLRAQSRKSRPPQTGSPAHLQGFVEPAVAAVGSGPTPVEDLLSSAPRALPHSVGHHRGVQRQRQQAALDAANGGAVQPVCNRKSRPSAPRRGGNPTRRPREGKSHPRTAHNWKSRPQHCSGQEVLSVGMARDRKSRPENRKFRHLEAQRGSPTP